ncbi:hypothetical protein Y032_1330g3829 [Ancylostoma ceylanicum]|uniref:Uncharacterized protein n=1 Tax=Ancylostoma ceylanicum TaxID=53326 RepID=A0A016W5D2_9BILA|nr:hypothetical protein Y032_1330g3829 [Ancylostoma ceylanicum]
MVGAARGVDIIKTTLSIVDTPSRVAKTKSDQLPCHEETMRGERMWVQITNQSRRSINDDPRHQDLEGCKLQNRPELVAVLSRRSHRATLVLAE